MTYPEFFLARYTLTKSFYNLNGEFVLAHVEVLKFLKFAQTLKQVAYSSLVFNYICFKCERGQVSNLCQLLSILFADGFSKRLVTDFQFS